MFFRRLVNYPNIIKRLLSPARPVILVFLTADIENINDTECFVSLAIAWLQLPRYFFEYMSCSFINVIFLAEFAALKEECASLRVRIQDIECEMKK